MTDFFVASPPRPANRYGEYVDATLSADTLTTTADGVGLRALYSVRPQSGSSDSLVFINPPAGDEFAVGDEIRIQPAGLFTITVVDGPTLQLDGGDDFAMDSPLDVLVLQYTGQAWREISRSTRDLEDGDKSVVWKSHTASGNQANAYEVYVPTRRAPGQTDATIRYAYFRYRNDLGVYNLVAFGEALPGDFLAYDAGSGVTSSGFSSTAAISGSYTGNVAYSTTPGHYLEFTGTGHSVGLRHTKASNGGFVLVTIDGSSSLPNLLAQVSSADFKDVSNAANNGSGGLRITTSSAHGLSTGARIFVENVGGITLSTSGPWVVTVVSSTQFDLDSSSGNWSGTFTSGGSIGYFRQADIGARYAHSGPIGVTWTDLWTPIADGLTDGSHAVRITALGSAFSGGSGGGRSFVQGVGFCSASTRFTAGVGGGDVAAMHWARVHDFVSAGTYSAISNAVFAEKVGGGLGSIAVTNIHGNETQSSWTLTVDGTADTLASDEYAIGYEVDFDSAGEVTYDGDKIADLVSTYRHRVGGEQQLRTFGNFAWSTDVELDNQYHGMLPLGIRNPNAAAPAVVNLAFDTVDLGGTTIASLDNDDNSSLGHVAASTIEAYSTTGTLRARTRLLAYQSLNGADVFLIDRSDGLDKAYFDRSTGPVRTVDDATVDYFDHGLGIWRQAS